MSNVLRGVPRFHSSQVVTYRVQLLALAALVLCGGCLHLFGQHAYTVNVHGSLVDGQTNQPIEGLEVRVSVGDRVIYDGPSDEQGNLDFTYRWVMDEGDFEAGGASGEGFTVVFQVEVRGFGVLDFPVTIGAASKAVSMGKLTFRPSGLE